MGRFTVDPAALHAVQATIAGQVTHAASELGALRTAAAELPWRGVAAVDFHDGWSQWAHGVEQLLASLNELGVAVGLSADDYSSTETGVQVAVNGSPA